MPINVNFCPSEGRMMSGGGNTVRVI
jgi:hypothetical protein